MKAIVHSILLGSLIAIAGCDRKAQSSAHAEQRSLQAARLEIETVGCASCHEVPGVPGAQGMIGPSLDHFARRNFIGGVLPNTPDNLVRWIANAPGVDPKTAMPNLNLTEDQSRSIASYLYTLK